jgi:hypothetical protein
MARDRSLDEFLGSESDDDGESDDGGGAEDAAGADGSDEPAPEGVDIDGDPESDAAADTDGGDDPEDEDEGGAALAPDAEPPAVEATMAFAPEGAACAACGATVERRWQEERGLVCADCKEW